MNYTQNYQLPQWVVTDRILRTDFNDSYEKIDAALDGLQDGLDAHTVELLLCGNCRVEHFSYTGTGSGATKVTFSDRPALFIIQGGTGLIAGGRGKTATFAASGASITSTTIGKITMSWSGNQVSLPHDALYFNLSRADTVYQVVAFYITEKEV